MWQLEEGSGSYHYLLNDAPAPVTETWQVARRGDAMLVVSERDAPGIHMRVDATIEGAVLGRFEVEWQAEGASSVRAGYERSDTRWRGWREFNGERTDLVLAHDSDIACYPLMRIFTGSVIWELADSGGKGRVLVPAIGKPQERDTLLLPDFSERRVYREGEVVLECSGGEALDCELWRFIGGQYSEDAAFWLDRNGRLLRYAWQQAPEQRWDVWLRIDS